MQEISRQRRFSEEAVKRIKSATLDSAKPEAFLGLRMTEKSSLQVFVNSESPCFQKMGVTLRWQ